MAKQTNLDLRNKTIYQVFVRQHSKTHDFLGLISDLDRIKKLGVDIIYLLPFHPIGKKDRKGSVGSPYAIYDYFEIDPLNGTLDDFKLLCQETHQRGMKIMMDIVFNHTSRDSVLTQEKPDWFYKKPDGSFANRIGDWSDITDLDMSKKEIWTYLVDVLKYWAQYVDGFRCDVAPLLPIDFWIQARKELDLLRPDLIWLTESVEYGFIKYLRDIGYDASTDSMMYDAFDIAYDYDIFSFMDGYLNGKNDLSRYLYELWRQEVVYPKNYVKLRSFENHDQERIAKKVNHPEKLKMMTAFQFFLKGTPMIYAGQEHQVMNRPDLFEIDPIPWNPSSSIEPLIQKLTRIKKHRLMKSGVYNYIETNQIAIIEYKDSSDQLLGIFNLESLDGCKIDLPNGLYQNLLSSNQYEVKDSYIKLGHEPIILHIELK
ncbi:Alpha-amylase 2 [Acholeplasma oculi]|uniref:Alpha-amylase n=1 Tax=Acholeplasma oculi TaxID=35623 RepID=A0A061AAE4_9MOLU|nr:alpha-amylase family glycosyl hydrolase [Acholeplasma oculi]CDR30803.1 Alpha-amylase [Acholeplasma oculi]SKC35044.1 Glycosidase [Acholeplasma oculi]SUT89780.1 Alpha-amylase 2 [Acholeplasma oculi]